MRPERWEVGSEFHWLRIPTPEPEAQGARPWSDGLLVSSGRDALRLVLRVGVRRRGWRRFWIPEYFCQHVAAALVRPGLELRSYVDSPLRAEPTLPDARPGDAILVVNYFGLRDQIPMARRDGVEIVEDHSHDPTSQWASESSADFCVASLRKTLPLPDGGAAWSPLGHALPAPPPFMRQRRGAVADRLTAMVLKAMYLDGYAVAKAVYRAHAMQGETAIAVPAVSAMSDVSRAILDSFPVDGWRQSRRENHSLLTSLIRGGSARPRVLQSENDATVPFSCVVILDSPERRDVVRRRLIEASVYPAILWPLQETVVPVGSEARDLSRRMLSIPCDGRYRAPDMVRVAELVITAAA